MAPLMRHEDFSPYHERLRGLYVIVDPEHTGGRPLPDVARAALRGGAKILQLRDKVSDKGVILEEAFTLKKLCDDFGAMLIVNDHADIAPISNAHGLHVGQKDLPVGAARQVLQRGQIIGTSNALMEEALISASNSVEYVAVGAIYETGTKSNTRPAGLETLARVKAAVKIPVAAIGGINASNVVPVVVAGADMVCVISAVCMAPDPEAAALELTKLIERTQAA